MSKTCDPHSNSIFAPFPVLVWHIVRDLPAEQSPMVRFDVRPELTLHGNNDASARVNVRFNHGPNIIDVGVTDKCVRNGGVSPDGLFIALRNGQGLDFEYGACRGAWAATADRFSACPWSTNPS